MIGLWRPALTRSIWNPFDSSKQKRRRRGGGSTALSFGEQADSHQANYSLEQIKVQRVDGSGFYPSKTLLNWA